MTDMGWPARDARLAFVGRFLPPTSADEHVLAFAAAATNARVTVGLLEHASDDIELPRRLRWLHEVAPAAQIVPLAALSPATQDDTAPDKAISSEDASRLRALADALVGPGLRDRRLAHGLELPYVPVDVLFRNASGTSHGDRSTRSREEVPAVVAADLVERVVIMGPESTGKTTLAADLARRYDTVWVGEYLRLWLDAKGAPCEPLDLPPVVAGQRASEEALAPRANRVLFCDTDALMTAVYSRFYYGELPAWLDAAANAGHAKTYLLLDCDVPWVPDPHRDMPHRRHEIRDLCAEELQGRGLSWHLVRGSWAERLEAACAVVDRLLR